MRKIFKFLLMCIYYPIGIIADIFDYIAGMIYDFEQNL